MKANGNDIQRCIKCGWIHPTDELCGSSSNKTMMDKKELEELDVLCQYINGVKQPCVVVRSHLKASERIEKYEWLISRMKAHKNIQFCQKDCPLCDVVKQAIEELEAYDDEEGTGGSKGVS